MRMDISLISSNVRGAYASLKYDMNYLPLKGILK